MSSALVVGIVRTRNPKEVAALMSSAGMDVDRIKVVCAVEGQDDPSAHFLELADLTRSDSAGSLTRHTGVLSDFGGTSVPGLSGMPNLDAFSHPRVRNYLGRTTIPDGEAEGYNDAIADGRCIVLYACGQDEAAAATSAMRKAGITDVRSYQS